MAAQPAISDYRFATFEDWSNIEDVLIAGEMRFETISEVSPDLKAIEGDSGSDGDANVNLGA